MGFWGWGEQTSNWDNAVVFEKSFSIVFYNFIFMKLKKRRTFREQAREGTTSSGGGGRWRAVDSVPARILWGQEELTVFITRCSLVPLTFLLGMVRLRLGAWGPGPPVRCTYWIWKQTIFWRERGRSVLPCPTLLSRASPGALSLKMGGATRRADAYSLGS